MTILTLSPACGSGLTHPAVFKHDSRARLRPAAPGGPRTVIFVSRGDGTDTWDVSVTAAFSIRRFPFGSLYTSIFAGSSHLLVLFQSCACSWLL